MSKSMGETQVSEERNAVKDAQDLKKSIIQNIRRLKNTEYLTIMYPKKEKKIKAEYCIYRVPEKLRKLKEDGYNPRVVSIGPFHRNKGNLGPMTQHKWYYMACFIDQCTEVEEDADKCLEEVEEDADKRLDKEARDECAAKCLEECINTIYCFDEGIRQCYTEEINFKEHELAEMMLLDGCFILELFLRFDENLKYISQNERESDPVLKSAWTMTALKHDLALLENQIPFFILENLYDIIWPRVSKCGAPESVASLALNFFNPLSQKTNKKEHLNTEYKHLLDLLHKFYFLSAAGDSGFSPNVNDLESNPYPKNKHSSIAHQITSTFSKVKGKKHNPRTAEKKWGFNYCASKLLESGIEFQVVSNKDESLSKITFERKDGVIHIPKLLIHDATSISLFRNLIAFEQCSLNSKHNVTSYAFLMRSLISSSRDSKLLKRKNIIQHSCIGDEEYLTNQFKSIVEGVVMMDGFCFREECDSVNEYHKSWYNPRRLEVFFKKQRRILCATYFSSTWKVISLLAAVILLVLTSLQTYYTIHPRH